MNRYTEQMYKGFRYLKRNGFSYTWLKVKTKLRDSRRNAKASKRPLYTKAELKAQCGDVFSKNIKISILVPLYNTPEQFLREMIRSVLDQTYGNWELCLADGSDDGHSDVGCICLEYAAKDQRIRYKKLETNRGISGNTNACIEMSTGDYIALFDHDDLLHPAALHDVMQAICEKNADFVYTDETTFQGSVDNAFHTHFKPDYSPDSLRSHNYICHFSVFSRSLLERIGGFFRPEFDGSQDYDIILRLTEQAENVVHIPKILYYWRSHSGSVASGASAKPYVLDAGKRALSQHLERMGYPGQVTHGEIPTTFRIIYEIKKKPLVSILIPNRDGISALKNCVDSIRDKTSYPNWEILVIGSHDADNETAAFYAELQRDVRIRVVNWDRVWNASSVRNYGEKYANGEYILLLDSDTEIITPDWVEQMLMFAQREDVGAVGAMLYYPDDTVQHGGMIVGAGIAAEFSHRNYPRNHYGYMGRMTVAQNVSAVTGACMLLRRKVWKEIGGLEEVFGSAFGDLDLCMRIRKAGYWIVWTPFAELYHYEAKSLDQETNPKSNRYLIRDARLFQKRWAKELAQGDPFYNPNIKL